MVLLPWDIFIFLENQTLKCMSCLFNVSSIIKMFVCAYLSIYEEEKKEVYYEIQ